MMRGRMRFTAAAVTGSACMVFTAACASTTLEGAAGDAQADGARTSARSRSEVRENSECLFDELMDREGCAEARPDRAGKTAARRRGTPSWVTRMPKRDGFVHGVGSGPTVEAAQREALSVLAAQLEVSVAVRSTDRISESRVESADHAGNETSAWHGESSASRSVRVVIERSVGMAQIEDSACNLGGQCHVLVALDLRGLLAEEGRFVEAVEAELSRLSAVFNSSPTAAARSYDVFREALSFSREVRAFEVVSMSTSPGSAWRRGLARLDRALRSAYSSVRATTIESPRKAGLSIVLTLEGQPLSSAPVGLVLSTGWGRLPEVVMTNESGRFSLDTSSVRGPPETELIMTLDPANGDLARALAIELPEMRIPLDVEPLRAQLDLVSAGFDIPAPLPPVIARFLRRAHGIRVETGSNVRAVASYYELDPVRVGQKTSQTVELRLDLGAAWPGQHRRFRGSGLGVTVEAAREEAVAALIRRMEKASR